MKKALMVAVLGAGAAMAFAMRQELRRYVMIKRVGSNPKLVGRSVTQPGNERALGSSDEQRRRDREPAADLAMPDQAPNLQPGDQAG
ncbi:MAG: hypothetical protein J2P24_12430 [Streptosporangiales bacterium]|nr:hypothetical protein [Streptosporangiales bacterium]MBO0890655.1 hypothetical protein [Acidothermales bacterium]